MAETGRDREELLSAYSDAKSSERDLDFRILLMMLGTLLLCLMLFVPKIYLRNQIYYTSRNLHTLQIQHDLLHEENQKLNQQLEDIKFKNLVMERAY